MARPNVDRCNYCQNPLLGRKKKKTDHCLLPLVKKMQKAGIEVKSYDCNEYGHRIIIYDGGRAFVMEYTQIFKPNKKRVTGADFDFCCFTCKHNDKCQDEFHEKDCFKKRGFKNWRDCAFDEFEQQMFGTHSCGLMCSKHEFASNKAVTIRGLANMALAKLFKQ